MTDVDYFAQYKLTTVASVTSGKAIPVSRAPIEGPDHEWVTIPWDSIETNPNDPLQLGAGTNRGWTVLYGPVKHATVTAGARIKNAQPNCSMHINLYKSKSVVDPANPNGPMIDQEMYIPVESWEWAVLPKETSSTHLNGTWQVSLNAGEKLRVKVDYWNATDPAKLTAYLQGARVSIKYTREISD